MGRDPPLLKGRPWSPGRMDAAELFDGSDGETVSHSSTEAASGAIELGTSAVYQSDLTTVNNVDYGAGILFTPSEDCGELWVEVDDNAAGGQQVYIDRQSDGTRITNGPTLAAGEAATIDTALTGGTQYRVYVNALSYDVPQGSVSMPVSGNHITVDAGWRSDNGSVADTAFYFSGIGEGSKSGSATVTWPAPDDLAGWDIIPFDAVPDGATVEVYAIDPSDGSTLAGPLDDPGDISALARSTNVGVGVELSRPDTSSNPRLEAVYRRYKV